MIKRKKSLKALKHLQDVSSLKQQQQAGAAAATAVAMPNVQ